MEGTSLDSGASTDNLYPALFQCFTIILCGYLAGRLNLVSQTEGKGVATFVGTFALPSLIFLSLARLDFSTVNWLFLVAILLAKAIVFFAVILLSLFISKPVKLGRAGLFAIFCTQSNDFALGFPIINAVYHSSHPEYASYLYLMAPISLAILNPIAFVLMEVGRQRENPPAVELARKTACSRFAMGGKVAKGIVLNPIVLMTVLGIMGNIVFKHNVPIYINGLLQVLGDAFSGSALFLLGLRMVGQFHRLRGPALVLPFVLIMVKMLVLPLVMREAVSSLKAGANTSDTQSLSTYAFLYGTIPTAPAVFVFSHQYQLEIDLVASTMVLCTFISAPMMFISAEMISITKDYAEQLKGYGVDLSIVALIASVWVMIVFIITKKYKRMPHGLTMCLIASQILLSVSVIWGGAIANGETSWNKVFQQALRIFAMYSCLLWTSMLAVGLLFLQSRGPCFVVTVWPVLGFVSWGAPGVMVAVLLAMRGATGDLESKACDAIRLCLLLFCLTVTAGSLAVYLRFRRRNAHYSSLSAEVAGGGDGAGGGEVGALVGSINTDETTSLVESIEPTHTDTPLSNGCYGAITATPSPSKSVNGCCSNDPDCSNAGLLLSQEQPKNNTTDIEDLSNGNRECACPAGARAPCRGGATGRCEYLHGLEDAAGSLGLVPPEQSHGRGGQLLKHSVLILLYSLSMFIGIAYTAWSMMLDNMTGIFVEIQFLDITVNYGQGLVMFALFGLDPAEILLPAIRYFKMKWYGADTLVLTPLENLSFETKHVCDQFISHHLDRCRQTIAKDTRWRMKTYTSVFRGECLVRWLTSCGLARDEAEAVAYGRHLLEGRLIAHIGRSHHFTNSTLLYVFL